MISCQVLDKSVVHFVKKYGAHIGFDIL